MLLAPVLRFFTFTFLSCINFNATVFHSRNCYQKCCVNFIFLLLFWKGHWVTACINMSIPSRSCTVSHICTTLSYLYVIWWPRRHNYINKHAGHIAYGQQMLVSVSCSHHCCSILCLFPKRNDKILYLQYPIMNNQICRRLLTLQFLIIKYKQLKDGITIHHPFRSFSSYCN